MTEGTGRIEAFSDGVFAIAITLLVLEIRLPHELGHPHEAAHGSLLTVLRRLWPSFFAFALSFFVILVSCRSFRRTGLFYLAAAPIAPFAPWVALAMNVAVRAYLLHIRYQSAKQAA